MKHYWNQNTKMNEKLLGAEMKVTKISKQMKIDYVTRYNWIDESMRKLMNENERNTLAYVELKLIRKKKTREDLKKYRRNEIEKISEISRAENVYDQI